MEIFRRAIILFLFSIASAAPSNSTDNELAILIDTPVSSTYLNDITSLTVISVLGILFLVSGFGLAAFTLLFEYNTIFLAYVNDYRQSEYYRYKTINISCIIM